MSSFFPITGYSGGDFFVAFHRLGARLLGRPAVFWGFTGRQDVWFREAFSTAGIGVRIGSVDKRSAYIALNLLPGIGPLRIRRLLEFFGDPAAVLAAPESALARISGIGPSLARLIHEWEQRVDVGAELELAERSGVRILTIEDPEYPVMLREIHDPPVCLYVRGNLEALRNRNMIAVVGTRRPTTYGMRMAESLASSAALAGWCVVSGLARGIDTVGHRAVLEAGGATVAVLGCGLGRIYPQENLSLARKIMEKGAVVSEYPVRFPPDRKTFAIRNRIIAGMCVGVVVVEAGARSGALITAGQAIEQGRPVFAVPGRVDTPQARGCHALIRDGARLTESFGDVLEEINGLSGDLFRRSPAPAVSAESGGAGARGDEAAEHGSGAALLEEGLTGLERSLLGLVREGVEEVDELVVRTGEPAAKVLGTLVMLEMRRLVRQLPGRRVVPADGTMQG